jgi:hypothetical protein
VCVRQLTNVKRKHLKGAIRIGLAVCPGKKCCSQQPVNGGPDQQHDSEQPFNAALGELAIVRSQTEIFA